MKFIKLPLFTSLAFYSFGFHAVAVEINIATVNNGHMIEMQKLSSAFEKEYPDISLNWHVYGEGSLRMRAIADIAAETNKYDVVTIGMYETPIWAKRGWLQPLNPPKSYDVNDILPAVKDGLSYNGTLYAAPFYGESSITMYRADLLADKGISLSDTPSWDDIKQAAAAIHDPSKGIYGVCLRGKPGWGDNMALISTIANSYGGQWFDMDWNPQLTSRSWSQAVNFYVDLQKNYGAPEAEKNSFNEILSLSREGKCGIWVDASVAASFLADKTKSSVADKWKFVQAPNQVTSKGSNWLWAWALAIPTSSKNFNAAQTFVTWATSKGYIELVAEKNGWANIPTGTRISTYNNDQFLQASGSFAKAELQALLAADPINNTLPPSPYQGIQFVSIPEFVSIGGVTAQKISEALEGKTSIEKALSDAQKLSIRQMQRFGYYD
ncbi:sugar ABC transporter substrate-binding protein [Vibrio galatheae]|uniref:Sugar ABC transporter substrate-binding protein n=1 Tax=Vibrio galatheae TaxID=579748 RepID=A0A0F4NFD8_9VIBR|nr:sugar ABC transporter substrate-binding protein [Vibrio galatheae]KJY81832.1 sugar ABC transporter substrate-binding protein [Vibrio galatheae]